MEGSFSDSCGFADGIGVLLSFFIPDAHGADSSVFVQYDNAGHFILDGMCFSSNAGICFWVSDLCAVSGIPSRLFRNAALVEWECSGLCGQCAVVIAAGSRIGKGEPR